LGARAWELTGLTGRRVAITGLGLVTPVGGNVEDSWKNIRAGVSGAESITAFETDKFNTRFSASVKDFDVEQYLTRKEARKMDTFVHYGQG